MKTRDFHIGDILSITTGRPLSPRHMDGIYDILGFMAGEELMTHQLPRVAREMAPCLLRQHPQLSTVIGDNVTAQNHEQWLAERIVEFGETLTLTSAHQFHEVVDPISEAVAMVGKDRVIRLDCPE